MRDMTLSDVPDGHVGLDLECFDWVYPNGRVPNKDSDLNHPDLHQSGRDATRRRPVTLRSA